MSVTSSLQEARQALSESESLLGSFFSPWDANDVRPLLMLRDAIDAQQRALVAMLAAVDCEQRISAGMRGRLNSVEAFG